MTPKQYLKLAQKRECARKAFLKIDEDLKEADKLMPWHTSNRTTGNYVKNKEDWDENGTSASR